MARIPYNALEEKPNKPALSEDQLTDLAFFVQNERCADLSDPGTGKTPKVCLFIQFIWMYEDCKTVWAMPKSLLKKNYNEILRFTDLGPENVQIVDGTPKKRQQQIENDQAVVFLMGFARWRDAWRDILYHQPKVNCVMGDEVHLGWKSHNSKTTQELFKSMKRVKRFLPMTGTLIAGRLDSVYPTVHIIEPLYYPNYWTFFGQHAITDWDGNIVGWRNHEKLGRILARHAVRRRFKDVYGDQQVVENTIMCEMTEAQREAYDEMADQAVIELENDVLDGSLPGVATVRCRQIMAHPETFHLLAKGDTTGKDEQLVIDIEDANRSNEPLLIFSALQPEQERIKRIAEQNGRKVGLINGNVSGQERSRIDQEFCSGKLDTIVASPATAAFGFNWGHVNHQIFISRDYQDDSYEQAKKRSIRGQRSQPLRVSIYEYQDSIDQRIARLIDRKKADRAKVDQVQ